MAYSSFTYKIEYKPKVSYDEDGKAHVQAEILLTQSHEHNNDLSEEAKCDPQEIRMWISKTAHFRTHVRQNIIHALQALEMETDCYAELAGLDWSDRTQFDPSRPPKHLVEKVDKMTSMLHEARMKRLWFQPKPGGSIAKYDLKDLRDNYEKALPMVRGAKERYKKNADSPMWMQIVKLEYPDMYDDLIARLSGKEKDLSRKHHKLLAKKGGGSSASDIALEWAARLCEVPPYHYTLGYLQQRKSKKVKHVKNKRDTHHD